MRKGKMIAQTEFGGVPTYTAVAIGPAEDANIDPITGDLSLSRLTVTLIDR